MSQSSHINSNSLPENKQSLVEKQKSIFDLDGVGGSNKTQSFPIFNKAQCERIISNDDAHIVLGKDRNASLLSGKSGAGIDDCFSIDMVVGRNSSAIKNGKQNSETMVDTNFFTDAARIFMSQKSDVDYYFGLDQGSEYKDASNNRSCVGLKADHVRIIGSNHIKIVTGRGKTSRPGLSGEKNSQGGEIESVGKIDFIAGNSTDPEDRESGFINKLQPLVKGENLLEFLKEILENLEKLYSFCEANTKDLKQLHTVLGANLGAVPRLAPSAVFLSAYAPFLGVRKTDIILQRNNLVGIKIDYLEDKGERYINSSYVNTT